MRTFNEQLAWMRREIKLASDPAKNPECKPNHEIVYKAVSDIYVKLSENPAAFVNSELLTDTLLKLMNNLPLTPLVDDKNSWVFERKTPHGEIWAHKRYPSLKKIFDASTAKVSYSDGARVKVYDLNGVSYEPDYIIWHIVDKMLPITMPYTVTTPIEVYCNLVYDEEDILDSIGVLYAKTPEGNTIDIRRYYRKEYIRKSRAGYKWVPISFDEYQKHKQDMNDMCKGADADED